MAKREIKKRDFLNGLAVIMDKEDLTGKEKISGNETLDSLVTLQMIVYIEQNTGELISGAELVTLETVDALLERLQIHG